MNRDLEQLLAEEIYTIKSDKNIFIESETGLPNPELLDYEKSKFVKESMEHLKDEIVVTNYNRPNNTGHNYNLLLDCVIIKRRDYERIKHILENDGELFKERV